MANSQTAEAITFDSDASQTELIERALEANETLLLVGGPGTGKSRMTSEACERLDMVFVDVRASQYDQVDVRGLPIQDVASKRVRWERPDWYAQVMDAVESGKPVAIGWEELNTASPGTMNTMLQAILDRRVGPHRFPAEVRQIAMVNRKSHRAHVNPMSAPLVNRFTVLPIEVRRTEWNTWAFGAGVHPSVISYINFRPEALYTEPARVADELSNFPTPRAWEGVSNLITKNLRDTRLLVGRIGEGAATEFRAYLEERATMPDIDRLIAGQESFDAEAAKISINYAVTVALAQRTLAEPALAEGCGRVLHKIPPEIAALYFALLLKSNAQNIGQILFAAASIKSWLEQHQALMQRAMR